MHAEGGAAHGETLEEVSDQKFAELYELAIDPETAPEARQEALEFLVAHGRDLSGIDLSCETMGRFRKPRDGDPQCLEGVRLTEANLQGANLLGANLQIADLENANFREASLLETDFTCAKAVEDAKFDDAWAFTHAPPKNLPVEIDLCTFDEEAVLNEETLEDVVSHMFSKPDPCIIEPKSS